MSIDYKLREFSHALVMKGEAPFDYSKDLENTIVSHVELVKVAGGVTELRIKFAPRTLVRTGPYEEKAAVLTDYVRCLPKFDLNDSNIINKPKRGRPPGAKNKPKLASGGSLGATVFVDESFALSESESTTDIIRRPNLDRNVELIDIDITGIYTTDLQKAEENDDGF